MRVHCLTTGRVRPKLGERGVRRYLPGDWSDETLPVNVFAIEHPGGVCVFDAGQTARAAQDGYFPRWYPFFRLAAFELGAEDEAAPQLQRLGLDPSAVRWVVLSHLHTDHVGGVDGFPHAEVLVSRVEWERAQGLGGRLRGYLPQYWPNSIGPRLVDFPPAPLGPFPSHVDLAGDGRLVLVPTPGHTPGHLSMLVREGERGFLCAGDLCHSPRELEVTAPAIHAFCRENSIAVLATHDEGAGRVVDQ